MPRATDWNDTLINLSPTSGAQGLTTLQGSFAPEDMRGVTVIRTIVSLSMFSETIAGAYGVQRLDMAIGIASQEAFAAAVLPDPSVQADKPARGWMWRKQLCVSQNGVGTNILFSVDADIRGARKVENGEVFFVIDNTATLGTTFTVRVRGLVRLLMKLS